jgi:hypothetical protein
VIGHILAVIDQSRRSEFNGPDRADLGEVRAHDRNLEFLLRKRKLR